MKLTDASVNENRAGLIGETYSLMNLTHVAYCSTGKVLPHKFAVLPLGLGSYLVFKGKSFYGNELDFDSLLDTATTNSLPVSFQKSVNVVFGTHITYFACEPNAPTSGPTGGALSNYVAGLVSTVATTTRTQMDSGNYVA
jgi:hypothetical protein